MLSAHHESLEPLGGRYDLQLPVGVFILSAVFIRYRNEDKMYPEEWVNVELTTHQITPEFFYKEHFEISDKAIENKIYLAPLTDRETVAAQLADLAFGYRNKFKYYDAFTRLCAEKSLEYYP